MPVAVLVCRCRCRCRAALGGLDWIGCAELFLGGLDFLGWVGKELKELFNSELN